MSRIGRKPIPITAGVTVSVDPSAIAIKGPKGNLTVNVPGGVSVRTDAGNVLVEVAGSTQRERSLHGLVRSLLANAVTGVTTGFTRELEIQGIGYKAAIEGRMIVLALGFSHPVRFPLPEGIDVSVEKQVRLMIKGYDKQVVGQVAANLRALRPPDVYKGKGIRYVGEIVRRKVGKAGAK